MRKLLTIVSSILFVTTVTAKAEIGMGVTVAAHMFDASGTETTRQSAEQNSGSHDETAVVPEIFIEALYDNGATLGISYIPTRDMGSKSRTDTSGATGQESGTYKAEAELDNVIQVYTDLPVGAVAGYDAYVKLGVQHVTLVTLESLNSGSTYPNKELFGFTIGAGVKGDLPYGNNMYYKGELTYTDFETYEGKASGNRVEADLEDLAAKFSIGYKF